MRVGLVLVAMVGVAVRVTGCGAPGPGATVTNPEPDGQIALRNGSSRDAWYVFTRRCGAEVWGEDELGPMTVLHPGQSAAWTEQTGCYDLLVLSNPRIVPRFEARYPQQLVAAEQQTAIDLADPDWSPLAEGAYPPGPIP
jgi:hypothetical protein